MSAPTPRTTALLVQGIIEVGAGVDLTPFIRTANQITTRLCVYTVNPYTDDGADSEMEVIERWLAAHFYTIFDNQLASAKAGTAAAAFQYKVDFGLKNSMYGQQAILLDVNGNLAKWDNSSKTARKLRIDLVWGGKQWDPGQLLWPDINTFQ